MVTTRGTMSRGSAIGNVMREWAVKRGERARHLIELGALVVKAGLIDLTDDDRPALRCLPHGCGSAAR